MLGFKKRARYSARVKKNMKILVLQVEMMVEDHMLLSFSELNFNMILQWFSPIDCLNVLTKTFYFNLYSAAVNSETQEEVAIKKVSKAFHNRIDAKRILREIKLLRHMNHDNVSSNASIIS